MRSFSEINPLRAHLYAFTSKGQSVGLVPTMGALHTGHEELIQNSLLENDLTVVSIFVNKTQFNNPEDFTEYPSRISQDSEMLRSLGCDILFAPTDEIMYPSNAPLKFDFGALDKGMEGRFRPGHFSGVGLIVSKLFNIVMPNRAYFGQKDIQQCAVIEQLANDLNFPLKVRVVPTVRDENGLALSSRNLRLTEEDRIKASDIYKTLCKARNLLLKGNMSIEQVKSSTTGWFGNHESLSLEYFEIVNSQTLQPITELETNSKVSLCMAAFLGEVRLIDNIYLVE